MYLVISSVLFAIFVANVVFGAFTRSPFMSDVQEMLVLFAASIAFTITILRAEAAKKSKK